MTQLLLLLFSIISIASSVNASQPAPTTISAAAYRSAQAHLAAFARAAEYSYPYPDATAKYAAEHSKKNAEMAKPVLKTSSAGKRLSFNNQPTLLPFRLSLTPLLESSNSANSELPKSILPLSASQNQMKI